MSDSSQEEYEEVDSPFVNKSSSAPFEQEKLKNKRSVFNRPFSSESSVPPIFVETQIPQRSSYKSQSKELIKHRSQKIQDSEIEYLDKADKSPTTLRKAERGSTDSVKKKENPKGRILTKIGIGIVSLLTLRLIFMDRGVWDYFHTEGIIQDKRLELKNIQTENRDLSKEIQKIQFDHQYQKQLAKEHLGVIAGDEFLILFAGESSEVKQTGDTAL